MEQFFKKIPSRETLINNYLADIVREVDFNVAARAIAGVIDDVSHDRKFVDNFVFADTNGPEHGGAIASFDPEKDTVLMYVNGKTATSKNSLEGFVPAAYHELGHKIFSVIFRDSEGERALSKIAIDFFLGIGGNGNISSAMQKKLEQYKSKAEYKDAIQKSLMKRGRDYSAHGIDEAIRVELLFNEVWAHGLQEVVARIRDVRMGRALKSLYI